MPTLFQQLITAYHQQIEQRKIIISVSNTILHDAKRVIFATHRSDLKTAEASLADIEKRINKLQKDFGYTRFNEEGAYQAALEEYVEAKTFYWLTNKQPLKKIPNIKLEAQSYLGGLCDLCGELVRQAINAAANHDYQTVKKNNQLINDILAELINFDMTGYLRTKYDQARQHLRKMEEVNYQISLK